MRKKFEYSHMTLHNEETIAADLLRMNEMGRDGWELVAAMPYFIGNTDNASIVDDVGTTLYFKREMLLN